MKDSDKGDSDLTRIWEPVGWGEGGVGADEVLAGVATGVVHTLLVVPETHTH